MHSICSIIGDAWERSIDGACVQKLGIYPHGAIHGGGMYSYSSWYWSRGSVVTVSFLVVIVHLVHPYRWALRGFVLMFDSVLGEQGGLRVQMEKISVGKAS